MTPASLLAQVSDAVEKGNWDQALELLETDDQTSASVEALELRAMASYGAGQFEASVAAWEAMHDVCVVADQREEAARAASMVAMYLMMDTGLMAPVRGWLQRATRLLTGTEDSPVRALIAMVRTYERFMCGDMEQAQTQSDLAIEIGSRLDVKPAVAVGMVASARINIFAGRVDAGIEALNEAGALLMSGFVDPLTTGMMYCELICAAQGLALYDMATEWTNVMEHWRHGAAFGGINGRCRVHRAEMLRVSGPSHEAEEEALLACDELRPWMRREFGWPLTELGNIRLRRDDLQGADEAFAAALEHSWAPQPGLALLRLAQGKADAAATLIADAVANPAQTPSKERPPFGDLRLAPLLEAQVEIAFRAGDLRTCRAATAALCAIAESYRSPSLRAGAALSRSRTAALAGDNQAAVDSGVEAVSIWSEVGAPYETASARLVLGSAHNQAGDPELAQLEWRAAKNGFETFGAPRGVQDAASLLAGRPSPVQAVEIDQRHASFCSQGGIRTISFDGVTTTLRDLKGLRYLDRLLSNPGREFHVLDLVTVEQGTATSEAVGSASDPSDLTITDGAMPVLDDQARTAYQRRLADIDEDIEEATKMNDPGRRDLAERDRSYLLLELSRAIGLGGRYRSVGGDAERARSAIARSLRYSLKRLAEHHPIAAEHLTHCLQTGTYCSYSPGPLTNLLWTTDSQRPAKRIRT